MVQQWKCKIGVALRLRPHTVKEDIITKVLYTIQLENLNLIATPRLPRMSTNQQFKQTDQISLQSMSRMLFLQLSFSEQNSFHPPPLSPLLVGHDCTYTLLWLITSTSAHTELPSAKLFRTTFRPNTRQLLKGKFVLRLTLPLPEGPPELKGYFSWTQITNTTSDEHPSGPRD